VNDREGLDPRPDEDGPGFAGAVRLVVLIAVFLVLPLVLMGATMSNSGGCGGG
jgi:hypothetical protein